MKKKIIIANWKAYVTGLKDLRAYVKVFSNAYPKLAIPTSLHIRSSSGAVVHKANPLPEIIFCLPFPFLQQGKLEIGNWKLEIALGAQDVFWEPGGAYTGEVTPPMLKDVGVTHVIIGHSERRRHLAETDDMVHEKILAALSAKLIAVLCIGEHIKAMHDDEERKTLDFIRSQLTQALDGVKKAQLKNIVVAYEPVWAISGNQGVADTPQNASRMIMYIRRLLAGLYDARTAKSMRVLYGGSVTAQNAALYTSEETIDGVLVGSASTHANEFLKIISEVLRV